MKADTHTWDSETGGVKPQIPAQAPPTEEGVWCGDELLSPASRGELKENPAALKDFRIIAYEMR